MKEYVGVISYVGWVEVKVLAETETEAEEKIKEKDIDFSKGTVYDHYLEYIKA